MNHMAPERYLSLIVSRALERQHVRAAADLAAHLDVMAAQMKPDSTAESLESAIEEALTAVRPHRDWRS